MPRFFFHLHEETVLLDPEGQEFPSAEAAREAAVTMAREIACSEVRQGHLGLNHRIEVTDAHDAPVVTIVFKEAIRLHP